MLVQNRWLYLSKRYMLSNTNRHVPIVVEMGPKVIGLQTQWLTMASDVIPWDRSPPLHNTHVCPPGSSNCYQISHCYEHSHLTSQITTVEWNLFCVWCVCVYVWRVCDYVCVLGVCVSMSLCWMCVCIYFCVWLLCVCVWETVCAWYE